MPGEYFNKLFPGDASLFDYDTHNFTFTGTNFTYHRFHAGDEHLGLFRGEANLQKFFRQFHLNLLDCRVSCAFLIDCLYQAVIQTLQAFEASYCFFRIRACWFIVFIVFFLCTNGYLCRCRDNIRLVGVDVAQQ